jgi:hypothetical protein
MSGHFGSCTQAGNVVRIPRRRSILRSRVGSSGRLITACRLQGVTDVRGCLIAARAVG